MDYQAKTDASQQEEKPGEVQGKNQMAHRRYFGLSKKESGDEGQEGDKGDHEETGEFGCGFVELFCLGLKIDPAGGKGLGDHLSDLGAVVLPVHVPLESCIVSIAEKHRLKKEVKDVDHQEQAEGVDLGLSAAA